MLKGRWRALWQHVDGTFLLALAAGIATSIFSLARVVVWLLQHYPEPVWALFFGLILASALVLSSRVGHWGHLELTAIVLGCALATGISVMPPVQLGAGLPAYFIAGMIAICAMILPGISGSFLLVLLGMYAAVLHAVTQFDVLPLAVFALGAGVGLLGFSRILYWLLLHWGRPTHALLTGFLVGSLLIVWPWKQVEAVYYDRHGEEQPLRQVVVGPMDYLLGTGRDPMWPLCLALALLGFVIVWQVNRRTARVHAEHV